MASALSARTALFQGAAVTARPSSSRAARRSVRVVASAEDVKRTAGRVMGALAAAQLAFLPLSGQAFNLIPTPKGLDTETKKEGVGATIEFSDITDQDSKEVIDKLQNVILPDVKNQLAQFAASKGSNYPDSIAKELETVEKEVEALLRQAQSGGNASNLKSLASGIEQQINALKAIVGFD